MNSEDTVVVQAGARGRSFNVPRAVFPQITSKLAAFEWKASPEGGLPDVFTIPADLADPKDVAVLLEHLSRRTPATTLPDVCALVRVTADRYLHAPTIHAFSRTQLEELVAPHAVGALGEADTANAEEALSVCVACDIPSIRKRLLYTVATTSHFEEPSPHPSLPTAITTLCATLQDKLIEHFTPVLFTVATASHMACTDVFAETWMPVVIDPALADSGLCRPVETLRGIKGVRWEEHGLCSQCCEEKRDEWEEEIKMVWRKVDDWIR